MLLCSHCVKALHMLMSPNGERPNELQVWTIVCGSLTLCGIVNNRRVTVKDSIGTPVEAAIWPAPQNIGSFQEQLCVVHLAFTY